VSAFGENNWQSNQSSGGDCDGLDAICLCSMWSHFVHRSVQCSKPVRDGVMRCTLAGAWQRPQRELDRTVGGGAEAWADIFNVP
jgi:hypothetical protein